MNETHQEKRAMNVFFRVTMAAVVSAAVGSITMAVILALVSDPYPFGNGIGTIPMLALTASLVALPAILVTSLLLTLCLHDLVKKLPTLRPLLTILITTGMAILCYSIFLWIPQSKSTDQPLIVFFQTLPAAFLVGGNYGIWFGVCFLSMETMIGRVRSLLRPSREAGMD